MNFFGHVVAASWVSDEPAFGLGSMLPDFVSIIGARLRASNHAATTEGIHWHHTTDAAFHGHEVFRRHANALTGALKDAGIGRGGSLAAGHVGVELLLDGLLLERDHDAGERLYLAALEGAGSLASSLVFDKQEAAHARFLELTDLLSERGFHHGYRDVATVTDRVLRVLARRPRLAIDESKRSALESELTAARDALAGEVATLTQSLRETLASTPGAGDGA